MRTTDWTLSHISFFPEAAQILETRLRSKRPTLQAWFIRPLRLEANSSVSLDFAFLDCSASPRTYRPVSTMRSSTFFSHIKSSHLNPAAAHDQACLPPLLSPFLDLGLPHCPCRWIPPRTQIGWFFMLFPDTHTCTCTHLHSHKHMCICTDLHVYTYL